MRQNIRGGFWGTKALPLVRVAQSDNSHYYVAHLGFSDYRLQSLDIREFLQAFFSGRLRYQVPKGCLGTVSVSIAPIRCQQCGKETKIVTSVEVDLLGADTFIHNIPDLEGHSSLVRKVMDNIPAHLGVDEIKSRPRKTSGSSHLSNGCSHCDVLVERYREREIWYLSSEGARFSIRVDEDWLPFMKWQKGWAVYSFSVDGQ